MSRIQSIPVGKIASLKECVFVNSALKICCQIVKNAFLEILPNEIVIVILNQVYRTNKQSIKLKVALM